MKPPPFDYFKPQTLDEALAILSRTGNARILAGGQSLMAMLNLRYVFPDALIDIDELFELGDLEVGERRVRIGALVRQRRLEQNVDLMKVAPIFHEAIKLVGHRQTRNRGTIGGSLCHLDPAAELPALAMLYEAQVEAAGPSGRRMIPIETFIAGFMMPKIEPDEIVTAVEFVPWSGRHGGAFVEFSRRHGDFAIASAACLVQLDRAATIERCSIVIGGLGNTAQRHKSGEASLLGTDGNDRAIDAAVEGCSMLEASGDFHGGAEYRRSVARTMLRRSLKLAIERAQSGSVA